MSDSVFYLTTPVFYPNGKPHIGHAYTDIAADVLARFHRLNGRDVFFLSGTDEHGLKMQQTAKAEGLSPQELADRNSAVFRMLLDQLNCSHDGFIRTTEPAHYRSSQALWEKMLEAGDIYSGRYTGWYSIRQEAYFDEKETVVGDDGIRREPLGSPVERHEESTFFFRLSAFQEKLLAFYEKNPDFIAPKERWNEVVSFVRSGLKDLSISRSGMTWGVPVPGDQEHVLYVWVDALAAYLTAVGYPDESASSWQKWWPAFHLIGKDILRFHAVYWPAFLMSAGLSLPKRIFAHGFLFNRGEKMSKSLGNVVDPFDLIELYGVDPLRYFLMREVPFGQDGAYSHEAIVGRIDTDLANDLGNLVQRCLSMISKNCNQAIPFYGTIEEEDKKLQDFSLSVFDLFQTSMEKQEIHLALIHIFKLISTTNRYFAEAQPWRFKTTDPGRMQTILYVTAEIIRRVALMCQAFMPSSSARLLDLLCVPENLRNFSVYNDDFSLKSGVALPSPYPVFPRYTKT